MDLRDESSDEEDGLGEDADENNLERQVYEEIEEEQGRHLREDYALNPGNAIEISVADFLDTFRDPDEAADNYEQAIRFLQSPRVLDWPAKRHRSRRKEWYAKHYIDYVCIVGNPYCPISMLGESMMMNVVFTLKNWSSPYSCNHGETLGFNMRNRTMHLGTFNGRYKYFIVMHPRLADAFPQDSTVNAFIKSGMENSALKVEHANTLAEYIAYICTSTASLASIGVRRRWKLGNNDEFSLTYGRWTIFIATLFEQWDGEMKGPGADVFWCSHVPHLHLWDYGSNLEIDLNTPNYDFPAVFGDELGRIFDLEEVKSFSCALATELSYLEDPFIPGGARIPLSMLAKRAVVEELWRDRGDRKKMSFYPIGLSRQVGNFQSIVAPDFMKDGILRDVSGRLGLENSNRDILNPGPFQCYNAYSHSVRSSPRVFAASHGLHTGATCTPKRLSTSHMKKRDRLRSKIERNYHNDSLRPLGREMEQIQTVGRTGLSGMRLEIILNFNVRALKMENRSFEYILRRAIVPVAESWLDTIRTYSKMIMLFDVRIFPGIIYAYIVMFDSVIGHYQSIFDGRHRDGLSIGEGEIIANLERLSLYTLTGDARVCPSRIWNFLGIQEGIRDRGFPYVNPQHLNIRTGELDAPSWPTVRNKDNLPDLAQAAALRFHYGPGVSSARVLQAQICFRSSKEIKNKMSLYLAIEGVILYSMIPETKEFVSAALRRRMRTWLASRRLVLDRSQPLEVEKLTVDIALREEALSQWMMNPTALMYKSYNAVLLGCAPNSDIGVGDAEVPPEKLLLKDYCTKLYEGLMKNEGLCRFGPQNCGWISNLSVIKNEIKDEYRSTITSSVWVSSLEWAFQATFVEAVPAIQRGKVIGTRLLRIRGDNHGHHQSEQARRSFLAGGVVLQAAIPNFVETHYALNTPYPFDCIPDFLLDGFNRKMGGWESSHDNDVLQHMKTAQGLLDYRSPAIELMLIIISVLTMATPLPRCQVPPDWLNNPRYRKNGRGGVPYFDHGSNNTDKNMWAAILATKMMWFIFPDALQNIESGCTCTRFANKTEQFHITSSLLLRIGWTTERCLSRTGVPPFNPRTDRVTWANQETLKARLKKYRKLLQKNNIRALIISVFDITDDSDGDKWLNRALLGAEV